MSRCRRRCRDAPERGSGTVLLAGVIAVILLVMAGGLVVVSAVHASMRARIAADQGALAGATALLSGGGDTCGNAERMVSANGARLVTCVISSDTVTINVVVSSSIVTKWGLGAAHARSRAGPQAAGRSSG